MANKNKTKGKNFERQICELFTKTYGVNFQRVPNSGAFVGGLNTKRYENLTNEQVLFCNRLCLVSTIELIKLNVKICYGVPCFDNVIDVCAKKIENVQGMADYAEHFKKKCLKSYRDQAKKKLVTFYFNRIEGLCPDVIEKIMTFY